LVVALSSHFNKDVFVLKLSNLSDETLLEAVSTVTPNSMIVMEDVDCTSATQDRDTSEKDEKRLGITLSGLLNVLDGLQTPKGAMFFMTTNYIDKLDAALLRPGRADLKIYLGPATLEQKQEFYLRFFPDRTNDWEFCKKSPSISMAEFQEELMSERNRCEENDYSKEDLQGEQVVDVRKRRVAV